MSSEPDIVVSMLGAKESMEVGNFTPDGFIQQYNTFIQEMKNMSSHPSVMLVSPIYSTSTIMYAQQPFKLNLLDKK